MILKFKNTVQSSRAFISQAKVAFILMFVLISPPLWAGLTIEISEGYDNATPIAVVPFGFEQQASANKAAPVDLAQVISANLRRSGQFKPLLSSSLPSQPSSVDEVVFRQWRSLDVDNMLIGKLVDQGGGFYQVDMRFMDVLRKKQVLGKRWNKVPKENLRQIAHQISDLIYEELTGVR
ncbi:MAG: Tol-Pal system protein TolB, partial [Thiomicrorhabdus sp.]|nr:Tol-Pal system protein TolB [Thiomicrorhabdus sp.]